MQSIKDLIEKTVEYNKPLVFLFIDFHKALVNIELKAMIDALTSCLVDYSYSKIIYNIYKSSNMTVNLHEASKPIKLGGGVRWGSTMSPKLFISVLDHAFRKVK